MIRNIFIRNIVLIEKLSLQLDKGLIVFSGETGAGKSIILTSLSLALGRRSEQNLIRNTASEGSVSIEFEIKDNHPSYQKLIDTNLIEENTLILRRVINKSGKSKVEVSDFDFVDGSRVSVQCFFFSNQVNYMSGLKLSLSNLNYIDWVSTKAYD